MHSVVSRDFTAPAPLPPLHIAPGSRNCTYKNPNAAAACPSAWSMQNIRAAQWCTEVLYQSVFCNEGWVLLSSTTLWESNTLSSVTWQPPLLCLIAEKEALAHNDTSRVQDGVGLTASPKVNSVGCISCLTRCHFGRSARQTWIRAHCTRAPYEESRTLSLRKFTWNLFPSCTRELWK